MYKIYPINELGKQTVSKFYENRDRIDFSPYYQRFGGIWSPAKKRLLIDTIINDFDIPKFYINYFIEQNNPLNINNKLYAVIDGKQRLNAIFDFLDNKFTLDKTCKIIETNDSLDNYSFDRISLDFPKTAKKILDYILDIVFIVTDEDDRLEEMFLRLNGGVALTNAEKRNAISSYFNIQIRNIITSHLFFQQKIRFKNPRFQHNDLLTKLLFIEHNNILCNLGNRELDDFIRAFSQENQESTTIIEKTLKVLDKFVEVFENQDMLLRGKGIIPVYYQFLKENYSSASTLLTEFLKAFESIRIDNRNIEEPNSILQEFDLFNQQGVHREKSLKYRYDLLKQFFKYFQDYRNLNGALDTIKYEDNSIDNFDDF